MGAKSGKIVRLKPRTIEELRNHVGVNFTTEEIHEWYEDFKSRLKSGQTELSKEQFIQVYDSLFQGDASEFAEHVFRTFDANGNGMVDFKEFILGLCISGSTDFETKLKWAFKMYDINGDGFITKDEMQQIIQAIYKMTNCMISDKMDHPDQLTDDLFKSIDSNHDEKITWEEFIRGASHLPIIVNLLECDPSPDEV
ncbi:hypothetical protein CHS0354_015150 [Potamilus streckersoni]|uniref:EF-hand domain-containing protein n=1 Tax=Potamilus streckersoni TaxID=2493646 RepID=A0AAE0VUH7_9BIVA|nr:hypothetical protein CHS0354_015150 [Potamilus streckersoni]